MPVAHFRPAAELAAIVDSIEDAIIATDRDGTIASWNSGAERMYGFSAAEAVGQPIQLIIPPHKTDEASHLLHRVRRGESIRDIETTRRRKGGVDIPILVTVVPIFGDDGVVGTMRIARDIAGHDLAERMARRLAAIVQSSDDAIVSKDLNGIVMSWNDAAERMFGYSAAEIVGESIRTIIPADRQSEEDVVLAKIRRGDKVEHFETIRQRKDGSLVPISLTVSPIRDARGTIVGASKIARDIGDRKQAEIERTRLLMVAQQNAAVTQRLNDVGSAVVSALDRNAIVQTVTDAATDGIGAQFGAFLYNPANLEAGAVYIPHTMSGGSREVFARFANERAADLFEPTFQREATVRLADVTSDAPLRGDANEAPTIRSFLAVPVKSRSGDVLGGLFFGHSRADCFHEQHERLASGIAAWASIALENSRLYVGVQEASRLKDEFLATLSHELRTPLNAILGYARMITSGIVAPDKQARAVDTIERNATSLTQIVEDVLDISRIISGKMRLNVQPVNVADVVKNAVETVAPAASAKGVRLEIALSPGDHSIPGDPERVQQVLWNLLSNAVKFTGRGGTVRVQVQRTESNVEIAVSDTGIGISRSFLPFVFDRFRQADSGTTRERGGLGLGLGISRQLVEMHGGTIEAHSGGEGQGSTFRVKLPLLMVAAEVTSQARGPRASPVEHRASRFPNLRGIRVLAVDDDRDALGMVREILEATGAQVAVADSATAALEALEAIQPDVLVADLGMPRMDGFELIARVRRSENKAVREVPAAAVTAYARSDDRIRALKCGFQMHIAKPIDPSELMAAIAMLAHREAAPAS